MADLPIQRLQVRLARPSVKRFDDLLAPTASTDTYPMKRGLGLAGVVHVAKPSQSPPDWVKFVRTAIEDQLASLTNRSNGALLLLRVDKRIFAFAFGQGRHLIKDELLVPDFGLITALNGLDASTLRGIDARTLDDAPVSRSVQTAEASRFLDFGLEIDRDIMRGVTGRPNAKTGLESLAGGDFRLSIGVRVEMKGLPDVCRRLLKLYGSKEYKKTFAFVDNMRVVVDPTQESKLWDAVVAKIKSPKVPSTLLSPPARLDWERHSGFRLTRDRQLRFSVGLDDYRRTFSSLDDLDAKKLKTDHLEAYVDANGDPSDVWPVYRCLTVDVQDASTTERFVCSGGDWFALRNDFATRIAKRVQEIPHSTIALPPATITTGKVEDEGAYNARAAGASAAKLALMDKQLVKCAAAGTTVEVCDLFTDDGAMIHVKHRKPGSSTLSHLFAQARVSAESLLQDAEFRAAARAHLASARAGWDAKLAKDDFDPRKHKVILAFLNCTKKEIDGLPFFSQLNLVRTYDAISRLGYTVEVMAIPAS